MSVLAAPRSLNRLTRSELLARVLAPLHTDEERWWDQRVHLPILSGASPSPPANGASAITAVRHSTHAPARDADDDSSSNIVVKLVQCDALHGVLNLSALRAQVHEPRPAMDGPRLPLPVAFAANRRGGGDDRERKLRGVLSPRTRDAPREPS